MSDELRDRQELRALVDAYAHHVDRREYDAIASLFTEDGRLLMYQGEPGSEPPVTERVGRADIGMAIQSVDRYSVTTHFLGQHSVVLDGGRASGETYCFAYGVTAADGARSVDVMAIRYLDEYVRRDNRWLIESRALVVDWTETRRS